MYAVSIYLLIVFLLLFALALVDSIQRRSAGWIIALLLLPGITPVIWLALRFDRSRLRSSSSRAAT